MKTITEELRKVIKDSGLSENQVAKESGAPQQMVNRFMAGEGIALKTAAKRCLFFKLHLNPNPEQAPRLPMR